MKPCTLNFILNFSVLCNVNEFAPPTMLMRFESLKCSQPHANAEPTFFGSPAVNTCKVRGLPTAKNDLGRVLARESV
jgi:hypothetical protein